MPLTPPTTDRLRVVKRVLVELPVGVPVVDDGRVMVRVRDDPAHNRVEGLSSMKEVAAQPEYDGGGQLLPHEVGFPAILVRRTAASGWGG